MPAATACVFDGMQPATGPNYTEDRGQFSIAAAARKSPMSGRTSGFTTAPADADDGSRYPDLGLSQLYVSTG